MRRTIIISNITKIIIIINIIITVLMITIITTMMKGTILITIAITNDTIYIPVNITLHSYDPRHNHFERLTVDILEKSR